MHRLHPGIRKTSVRYVKLLLQKSKRGMVMKKEEMNQTAENQTNTLSNVAVGIAVIIVILALILFVRKRRKSSQM